MAANLTIVPAPGRPKVLLCLCPAIRILNPNTEKLVARSFAAKSAVVVKCGDIRNSRLAAHRWPPSIAAYSDAVHTKQKRNMSLPWSDIVDPASVALHTHTHTHTHALL